MLKKFWLCLGSWLGKILLLVLALGLCGWLISSLYYGWKFSGPVSREEQIPVTEKADTQAIIADAIRVVE